MRTDHGNMVLAMYRPKAGKEEALRALLAAHVRSLRAWGMATERAVTLLRASDGTYVEIFEWLPGAAERSHDDPRVRELWRKYEDVCEYATLASLPDAQRPFPHFELVEGVTV